MGNQAHTVHGYQPNKGQMATHLAYLQPGPGVLAATAGVQRMAEGAPILTKSYPAIFEDDGCRGWAYDHRPNGDSAGIAARQVDHSLAGQMTVVTINGMLVISWQPYPQESA